MKALLVALAIAPAIAHAETRPYVVVEGDTCLGIVYRELGDPKKLVELHALNPQLGKLPHKLVAGQILNLPGSKGGPDAHLRATRGRVEVLPAGTERWGSGTIDQELFRTWRVGTRAKAAAKVEFVDRSTIDMREDTVVMIFGPTAGRRSTLRTQLDRGVLRTRLAALDRKVVVETPAGKAELATGSAVIDVDAAKETRLANHSGEPARLANARGNVRLAAGYGSRVVPDRPPAPPIKLLPAPRWEAAGELALAWTGDPITLRGRWVPVAGAVKYRIEVARAATPLEAETRAEVPGTITRLEATGLPADSYLVTVASVDKDGLEGPPSAPLLVQAGELPRPSAITGTRLEPARGLRCARGDAPPVVEGSPVVLVRQPGTDVARITCASATGRSTLELAIPAPRFGWPASQLTRGEPATFEIQLGDVDPASVQTIAGPGVEITSLTRHPDRLELQLIAPAAGRGHVAFVIDGVTVATEVVTVVEPSSRSSGDAWHWGLGAYAGTTAARDDDTTIVGGELYLAARPWLAPYLGIAKLSGDREGTARLGLRTAFARRLRPILRAGLVVAGTERLGGEVGAGVEVGAGSFAIRAEATAITDGSDQYVQGVIGLTITR